MILPFIKEVKKDVSKGDERKWNERRERKGVEE